MSFECDNTNHAQSSEIQHQQLPAGMCRNEQQTQDLCSRCWILLLDPVGIGTPPGCGVVGFRWIEQGAQTDPEGGQG